MELKILFWDYLWVIWILTSFLFIRFYFYIFAHYTKLVAKPVKEKFGTPRILFQVTTKGNIGIVQDTINRINVVCREIGYTKYCVWAVTDALEEFEGCKTIVVPQIIGATLSIKAEHYSTLSNSVDKKK